MARRCEYCGTENEHEGALCVRCGNELGDLIFPPLLPPDSVEVPRPPANVGELPPMLAGEIPAISEKKRELGAASASFIFLGYFGAQTVVGLFAGLIGFAVFGGAAGLKGEGFQQVMVISMLPMMALSGLMMLIMALRMIPQYLRDRSATGAAWVVGAIKENATGLMFGILTALAYVALAAVFPPTDEATKGSLSRMALTPGVQQVVWIVAALLFAPLVEECLFRGIMYGGFRRSFGPVWAAILSTLIFWSLHLTEMWHYWPAMIAIAMLALVALWHRLKYAAVGPAVSVHIGYNGMMVVGAIVATLSGAGR